MSRAVQMLLPLAVGVLACRPTPGHELDGAVTVERDSAPSGATVSLAYARPFGEEGETPTGLVVTRSGGALALTDRAIYQLAPGARVLHRWDLPVASSGTRALVLEARWDGVGLGALVRWGTDDAVPAGSYLALTDERGAFAPGAMLPLGSATSQALVDWDGSAGQHQVIWSKPHLSAPELTLELSQVVRPNEVTTQPLLSGLPSTSIIGDWVTSGGASALCSVEPGGKVKLRRFTQLKATATIELTLPGRRAVGSCELATSGRSHLVIWTRGALPPEAVDAGIRPDDLGPGSLSYDHPVAQLVDPEGRALSNPVQLSTFAGTVQVESVLWDGLRYMVLLNPVSYRGGRMVLAAIDEAGQLLWRDVVIPLPYEPGQLVAGRLAVDQTHFLLLYSSRRPWDQGVLHLARLTLSGPQML